MRRLRLPFSLCFSFVVGDSKVELNDCALDSPTILVLKLSKDDKATQRVVNP